MVREDEVVIIKVQINVQSNDELKVFWSGWAAYTISKQAVEHYAEEIRSILLELVRHHLEGRSGSPAPILKRLAERGNLLYQSLFTKIGDDDEEDPEKIKAYLATLKIPFRLDFIVSNFILVPWGLIYPEDHTRLPTSWDGISNSGWWNLYCDFWCFAHDLTVRYSRTKDKIDDASALTMLRVAHPVVFKDARQHVKSNHEQAFIKWLDDSYGIPICSESSLIEAWRETAAKTGLVYFYCHASATNLALNAEEYINVARLFLLLANPKRTGPGCLLVVNGCRTAVGDPRGSFMLSASTGGLCGFVGTETDVPDVFALRFSTSLLHLLFRGGKTLGEAMHSLYRDHFPLSLVYSFCAHRDFRMSQQAAPDMDGIQNFSVGAIGTRRLESFYDA
jgi:hypothetical protein